MKLDDMPMRELRSPTFQTALLDLARRGIKTQTRRVAKQDIISIEGGVVEWAKPVSNRTRRFLAAMECFIRERAPYGQPGDVWALREPLHRLEGFAYYADGKLAKHRCCEADVWWKWQRCTLISRFMPQWAARDFVTVQSVRIQRAQDISEADCLAEGITYTPDGPGIGPLRWHHQHGGAWHNYPTAKEAFGGLLDSLKPEEKPFENNMYLWAYTFGDYVRDPGRPL